MSPSELDAGAGRRRFVGFMPPKSLLLAVGSQRNVLRKAIGKAMAQTGDDFVNGPAIANWVSQTKKDLPSNFERNINQFCLQSISKFLVGTCDARLVSAIEKTFASIDTVNTATMIFPWLRQLPPYSRGYQEISANIEELKRVLMRMIRAGVSQNSFLFHFMEQASENRIDQSVLLDNMAMFCFVMPRSLRSMYLNMTHSLAVESAWQNRLRREIARNVQSMKLMRATVKESLRMAPMIPFIVRKVQRDLNVDGFELHKNDFVVITPYITHFRSSVFDRPDEFDPSRFLGERDYINEYIPYGGGQSHCVGSGWSMRVICELFNQILPEVSFHSQRGHADLNEFSMRSLFLKRQQSNFSVRFN
jgi:cytochrome P450